MADHESKYTIRYVVDESKALRGLASIEAALKKTQGEIQKTAGMIKALGQATPGLKQAEAELKRLAGQLGTVVSAANKAEKELKDVGKGNSSLGPYAAKVEKVTADLNAASAAGGTATASLGGVGKGGPGTGAGGKGGGAGGKPGGRVAAMARAAAGGGILASVVRHTIGAAGESLAERRAYLEDAADATADYRQKLTGLATLKGKLAPDDELIRSDLAFQKSSLMNPDESRIFRTEFGGAVDPALKSRDKAGNARITQKTADELEVQAAKFTARYGLDATTGGRMAGLLGVTQNIPSAGRGVGIMAETMEQLNVAGVGQVKDLARHMFALSGGMLAPEENEVDDEGNPVKQGGRFPSYPAMAARFAATTISTVGGASVAKTKIRAVDRMMRKNTGKMAEFRQKIGVTEDMDFEEMLKKFEPHVLAPNGDDVLKEHGYANSYERTAIIEAAGLRQQVQANLANPRMKAAATRALTDSEAFDSTIGARQQQAANADFASTIEVGMTAERMKAMKAAATSRLKDQGTFKAGIVGTILDKNQSLFTTGLGVSGEDLRVDAEAMRGLIEGGRQVNVDVRRMAPTASHRMDAGMQLDEDATQKEINRAFSAVEAAGGDPFGGAPKDVARKLRAAADAVEKLDQGRGGQQRPPMPPPPGDGGAGFTPARR